MNPKVPFLLILQAVLCYSPRLIWRSMSSKTGMKIANLVDACLKYDHIDRLNDHEQIMMYITRKIERYLADEKRLRFGTDMGKRTGKTTSTKLMIIFTSLFPFNNSDKYCWNYVAMLYLSVKTIWLINAISQFYVLNTFIGNEYYLFGFHVIRLLYCGNEWQEFKYFPRVTYCDIRIDEIGNTYRWTVQCVLPINAFNEIVFIFMWFWFFFLSVFVVIDISRWVLCLTFKVDKNKFFKQFSLCKKSRSNTGDDDDFENTKYQHFLECHLNTDVFLVLRLLAINSSDMIVSDIVKQLWTNFDSNCVENLDNVGISSFYDGLEEDDKRDMNVETKFDYFYSV
jgi:hypothetical protein